MDMGFQKIIGPSPVETSGDLREGRAVYTQVRNLGEAVRFGFGN
jgi:hypothetical protein